MSPLAQVEILPPVLLRSAEREPSGRDGQDSTPDQVAKVPRNMLVLRDKIGSREVLDNYQSLLELRDKNNRQRKKDVHRANKIGQEIAKKLEGGTAMACYDDYGSNQ